MLNNRSIELKIMTPIFISHADTKLPLTEDVFNSLRDGEEFSIDNAWTEDEIAYTQTIHQYSQEDGDTYQDVIRAIGRYFKEMFMEGDCWDFALSLSRNYGLKLGVVKKHTTFIEGEEDFSSVYGDIEHVFAILDDGKRIDIRGIFDGDKEFLAYRQPLFPCWFEDITPDVVIDACNDFARLGFIPPADFNNPETYEKAAIADQVCDLLYGDLLTKEYTATPGL
jgi:hypothetical protein